MKLEVNDLQCLNFLIAPEHVNPWQDQIQISKLIKFMKLNLNLPGLNLFAEFS